MVKITLARALKISNILAGKLAKVQAEISAYNSVVVGTEQPDVRALLAQRESLVGHILALKTAHYKANMGIQETLYTLGETKSSLTFFNSLQTYDGDIGQVHYGTDKKILRQAVVKKPEKDEMVAGLESKIEELQEAVDQYNHSHYVEVDEALLEVAGVKNIKK